jgi:adenosylmethionine---8-amino-7-oxononanoate aminotransferase
MTLKDRDTEYIWHPFDQMKGAEVLPIVKGKGCYLFDENGNKYIDGFSSWWVNAHGHCNPTIATAVSKQLSELEHVAFGGFTHPQAVQLAENIIRLTPKGIDKVFFSDNGSTANEVALKMSIQYWSNKQVKKDQFIAIQGDYHGDTFGSMCLTSRGGFNEPFEQFMFDVKFIPRPSQENRDEVISLFKEYLSSGRVAAFIFEPIVQGACGMQMYDASILSEIIGIAKENHVITIADEVFTGFGRTGKWFACDHLKNKPDIMCLSKALTGGFLPLGLTVVNNAIYDGFYSDDQNHTFLHGHSYTGNPLACAAANASISLFENPKLWENITIITNRISHHIEEIKQLSSVRTARSFGMIGAVEIDAGGASSYFNKSGKEVYKKLLGSGVILRPLGNVFAVVPPYVITVAQLDEIFQKLKEVLA